MKTIYRTYDFDVGTPEGLAAWQALKSKLASGPHCMESLGHKTYCNTDLDGREIELETAHLFGNQWNTAPIDGISEKGLRVFDWAQDAPSPQAQPYCPANRRRGHYLEQTPEMQAIRHNTNTCGYCGWQESAPSPVFCPKCIDSEYLTLDHLHLTRMVAIDATDYKRAPLTDAESAYLLPLFKSAQLHGTTERGKARIAKARADIVTKRDSTIAAANAEHDGLLWLMDHGIRTDNAIFYKHTGRFGFGWRAPVTAEILSELLDVISEFPFPYDIKTADGRTLSGD